MKSSFDIKNISCLNCDIQYNKLFSKLNSPEIDYLNNSKTCKYLNKKNMIFNEGAPAIAAYCIRKGKIKLYKTGVDGKKQIIKILNAGSVLE